MANMAQALLFDTRSIQRYIYAGNRLKTNIGASYLVDCLFTEELYPVLRAAFPDVVDMDGWQTGLNLARLGRDVRCLVASNGGGSALVLFAEDTEAAVLIGIVRAFSKRLLVTRPGLHIGAARGHSASMRRTSRWTYPSSTAS